jgi:hypothetical protein
MQKWKIETVQNYLAEKKKTMFIWSEMAFKPNSLPNFSKFLSKIDFYFYIYMFCANSKMFILGWSSNLLKQG